MKNKEKERNIKIETERQIKKETETETKGQIKIETEEETEPPCGLKLQCHTREHHISSLSFLFQSYFFFFEFEKIFE
jgi:hypothetical protein